MHFSAHILLFHGMERSSLVGKDVKLDVVGGQFKPYLLAGCVCILVAP